MVGAAQENAVVDVVVAAMGTVVKVVRVAPARGAIASGEYAVAVASCDQTLFGWREGLGALGGVDDRAVGVAQRGGDPGAAEEPVDGPGGDGSAVVLGEDLVEIFCAGGCGGDSADVDHDRGGVDGVMRARVTVAGGRGVEGEGGDVGQGVGSPFGEGAGGGVGGRVGTGVVAVEGGEDGGGGGFVEGAAEVGAAIQTLLDVEVLAGLVIVGAEFLVAARSPVGEHGLEVREGEGRGVGEEDGLVAAEQTESGGGDGFGEGGGVSEAERGAEGVGRRRGGGGDACEPEEPGGIGPGLCTAGAQEPSWGSCAGGSPGAGVVGMCDGRRELRVEPVSCGEERADVVEMGFGTPECRRVIWP